MLFASIKSISTTSWCPKGSRMLIALGSASGTLDASFDTRGELGIYELCQDGHPYYGGGTAKLLANLESRSKFTDLSWGLGTDKFPDGVIATGLEDGYFNLWNAEEVLKPNPEIEKALLLNQCVSKDKNPGSSILCLEFSPNNPEIIAMAQSNGEIYVQDLLSGGKEQSSKVVLSASPGLTSISWNKQAHNILGASAYNGGVSIWDIRKKSRVMELKDPGSRLSLTSMLWDPSVATRIVTASGDDHSPFMCSWDMRNPNSPESVFKGHEKGVLSMSWCDRDPDLLVSCSKDAKVLLWNAKECYIIDELARSNNWVFKVTWSAANPSLIASSSFDGYVNVHDIMRRQQQPAPGANNAQCYQDKGGFVLQSPPKWLKVTSGSSFAYGNKLVSFEGSTHSVTLKHIYADPELSSRIWLLEKVYMDEDKQSALEICSNRIKAAGSISDPMLRSAELYQWKIFEHAILNDINSDVVMCLYALESDIANKQPFIAEKDSAKVKGILSKLKSMGIYCPDMDNQPNSQFDLPLDPPSSEDMDSLYQDMSTERKIESAIYLGDIETAAYTAAGAGKFTDSLIIASLRGPSLLSAVKDLFFEKEKEESHTYMQIIRHISKGEIHKLLECPCLDIHKPESRSALISIISRYSPSAEQRSMLYRALSDKLLQADVFDNKNVSIDYTTLLCCIVSKDPRIFDLWHTMLRAREDLVVPSHDGLLALETLRFDAIQNFMEKLVLYGILIAPIDHILGCYENRKKVDQIILKYAEYISDIGFFKFASVCLENVPLYLESSAYGKETSALSPDDREKTAGLKNRLANVMCKSDQSQPQSPLASKQHILHTDKAEPQPDQYAPLQSSIAPYQQYLPGYPDKKFAPATASYPPPVAAGSSQVSKNAYGYAPPRDVAQRNPSHYQADPQDQGGAASNTFLPRPSYSMAPSASNNMTAPAGYNPALSDRDHAGHLRSYSPTITSSKQAAYDRSSLKTGAPGHHHPEDGSMAVSGDPLDSYNSTRVPSTGGFNDPPEDIFDDISAQPLVEKDKGLPYYQSKGAGYPCAVASALTVSQNSQQVTAPHPTSEQGYQHHHSQLQTTDTHRRAWQYNQPKMMPQSPVSSFNPVKFTGLTTQPQYPAAQPPHPAAQPQYSATQPQYSATQPQHPVTQFQHSVTQPQYSAIQPQYPTTQPPHPPHATSLPGTALPPFYNTQQHIYPGYQPPAQPATVPFPPHVQQFTRNMHKVQTAPPDTYNPYAPHRIS